MKDIILSSSNKHKVKEIKEILFDLDLNIISKDEIGYKDFDVIEDGKTLEENSYKKAKELWDKTKSIVIADDTGLFVDAIDGEPGVYSARYAGEDATYQDNNLLLLNKLNNVPKEKRKAYFETVIILIDENGKTYKANGICEGEIGFEAKGINGFGYDPLFIVKGLNKTFAELTDKEKNKYSHRGKAIKNLKQILEKLFNESDSCK